MELIKPGQHYDFMSARRYFVGLSVLLVMISGFFFYKPGPRLGTDFKGGTEVELAFTKDLTDDDIRKAVEAAGFTAPDVVAIADSDFKNHFMVRVQDVSTLSKAQEDGVKAALCVPREGQPPPADRCPAALVPNEIKFSPGGDKISLRYAESPKPEQIKPLLTGVSGVELRPGDNSIVVANDRVELFLKSKGDQLLEGLHAQLGNDALPVEKATGLPQAMRVEWIGPKAGEQLRDSAIKSIIIAVFFIMVYIAFRFDMRFAPGGIIALIHDVIVAMGAMILAQRDITLSTVAAMLTIVGYSINDTVIVFDRIRENLGKFRGKSFTELINLSISEMLGRTIITSGLTALSMVSFLFFGTGVIKDFAFALLIGVIAGTYSSIYVAAPITEYIDRKFFGSKVATARRKVQRTRSAKRAETVV
jgi:preprotein translocase subunit SecF